MKNKVREGARENIPVLLGTLESTIRITVMIHASLSIKNNKT
jgi:hypothetical protein